MSDVRQWLVSFDLGEYADVFEAERVDLNAMPELSDDDLRELGLPLGIRRRLQKALREHATTGAGDVGTDNSATGDPPSKTLSHWSRRPGDRRPVTLLFADVSGSTALTERLDPEDTHNVLYGAVERICEAVERHRGTVCRFMGDGLMAMFGIPHAYETHPRAACLAALDVQAAIQGYSQELQEELGATLQVRVGIHSGEIVALRVGDGAQREWDASGPAVPLAARMEQCAAPGTTLMTASTFDLVRHEFDGDPLPPVQVKGFSEPIDVVKLCCARSARTAEADDVPLIGRHAELAYTRAALDCCRERETVQIVFIRGEPGIGKTRLTQEVVSRAVEQGFHLHRTAVLDFGGGHGQSALPALVWSLLDLPADADENSRRKSAAMALESGCVSEAALTHLNDLLNLRQARSLSRQLELMSSEERLAARAALLRELLVGQSTNAPCLVVIEDLHWADEDTFNVLAGLLGTIEAAPVTFLLTSRRVGDSLDSGWRTRLHATAMMTLDLAPLGDAAARELASSLDQSDESFVHACLQRAEGNPLFLKHLLRMPQTTGGTELPTSVQTLITVSLDKLAPEDRQAIQAAAVLGQRFEHSAVSALVGGREQDLAPLIAAELIRPDKAAYLFTHALVRDGVLASLLRDDRRALHQAAAGWFKNRDAVLHAAHLDQAGDAAAGAAYLRAAREQAHWYRFGTCIDLLKRGIERAQNDAEGAAMHRMLGEALSGHGRFRDSATAYSRALELERDATQRCQILIAMSAAHRNTGNYEQGLQALGDAESEAKRSDLLPELVEIHFRRSSIGLSTLDADESQRNAHRALELARHGGNVELIAMALGGLARYHTVFTGRYRTAGNLVAECLEMCRMHGFGQLEGQFVNMDGVAAHALGDPSKAIACAQRSVELAPQIGDMRQATLANTFAGRWALEQAQHERARDFCDEALRMADLTGERRYTPYAHATLALLQGLEGDREAGLAQVNDALERCTDSDRRFGRLWLLGALALLAPDDVTKHGALSEGESIALEQVNVLAALDFRWAAINACLALREWEQMRHHSRMLAALVADETIPLFDTVAERGLLLAAVGDDPPGRELIGRLRSCRLKIQRLGLEGELTAIDQVLSQRSG
jgi:class 3 adenylate cyclase/tetratricopeptide (TPR) repeat protein